MLTRENLQEFCRTCLKSLPTNDNALQYNIYVVPNLQKLLVLFTSPRELCSDNDIYPRNLCQICYYKLLDFSEFRELVSRSAHTLDNLVKGIVCAEEQEETRRKRQQQQQQNVSVNACEYPSTSTAQSTENNKTLHDIDKNNSKSNNNNADDDDDDDNKLLLPELVDYQNVPSIKTERIDDDAEVEVEQQRVHTPQLDFVQCGEAKLDSDPLDGEATIKEEIDWDDECDESSANPLYAEQNYAIDEHDTIADDADDEEHALRNGAANASTNTLRGTPSSGGGGTSAANSARKRDRSKKSFKCPRCDKSSYKQVYLEAHIRRDHEGHDKPFVCNECPKAFTRYNQLHVHVQSNHLLAQKFVCEFDGCNATFRLSNTLETHRQVKHATDGSTTISVALQTVLETQLNREIALEHICPQCGKKYSSKRALSEHLKRHAQIKEHMCTVCGAAKVTRTELQTHMRTHNPTLAKFMCPQCPQEFNHKNAISRHIRVVHEGQRRFICSYCPRRFGTRNSQVCHERLHTGERPFNCEMCEKNFAQLEGLRSHMKSHDKNLRKHVCGYCAQRFITRKNLLDHELRHRGDKPHICNICSRGFCNSDDLTVHRNTHTDESDDCSGGAEEEQRNGNANHRNETAIKIEHVNVAQCD